MTEEPNFLREAIKPRSDQLNYDDLVAGPITVKVVGLAKGSKEQPVVIKIEGIDGTKYDHAPSFEAEGSDGQISEAEAQHHWGSDDYVNHDGYEDRCDAAQVDRMNDGSIKNQIKVVDNHDGDENRCDAAQVASSPRYDVLKNQHKIVINGTKYDRAMSVEAIPRSGSQVKELSDFARQIHPTCGFRGIEVWESE